MQTSRNQRTHTANMEHRNSKRRKPRQKEPAGRPPNTQRPDMEDEEMVQVLGREVPISAYNKVTELYLKGKSIEYIVKKICQAADLKIDLVVDAMVREMLRREGYFEDATQSVLSRPSKDQTSEPTGTQRAARMQAVEAQKAARKATARARKTRDRIGSEVSLLQDLASIPAQDDDKVNRMLKEAREAEKEAGAEVFRQKLILQMRNLALSE